MTVLLYIVLFAMFIFGLERINTVRKLSKKIKSTELQLQNLTPERLQYDYYDKLPNNLGIKKYSELEKLVSRLENSLDSTYMKQVKERVLKGGTIHKDDYEWYLLELKRFFILSSVLKNVPMYNEKVDEIWHEMLMFTKSYSKFCEGFVGRMVDHEPNTGDNQGNPEHDRAWFEYVYTQFFELTPCTHQIYGDFFNYPINKELLENILVESDSELMKKYFSANTTEAKMAATTFIASTQSKLKEVKRNKPTRRINRTTNNRSVDKNADKNQDYNSSGLLYYSFISDDDSSFEKNMKNHNDSISEKDSYSYKPTSNCSGWSSCSSSNDSPSKSSCKSCSSGSSSCSSSSSSCSSSSCSSCSS